MKEFYMVVGFGAGLVAGALLYKHSQEAKKIVKKGEDAVKKEVENIKNNLEEPKKKTQKSKA